jgi:hypothetical protein
VDVYEEEISMTVYENETESRFFVSPEQLGLFFAPKSVFIPEKGLAWEARENGVRRVLFVYPKKKTPVTIYPSTPRAKGKPVMRRYPLLFPAIAIRANISTYGNRASVSRMDCWCMDTDMLKADTNLFEMPLPNCTSSSICLGNIERNIEGPIGDALWEIFFNSTFSHHNQTVGRENLPFPKFAKAHKGVRISTRELNKIGKGRDIMTP